MIDQFTNLTIDGTALALLVVRLLVIGGIGVTYWKMRSVVPTVVAVLVGGFVWWAVNNVDTVSNKVDADLGAPAPVVFELPVGAEW